MLGDAARASSPLLVILFYIVAKGAARAQSGVLHRAAEPPGEPGGGMANAIVGTLDPRRARLRDRPAPRDPGAASTSPSSAASGSAGSCASSPTSSPGVPSIIVGVFVYAPVVVPMKRFSALAGGLALAIVMLPTVTRTTEELLRLVPDSCARPRSRSACRRGGPSFSSCSVRRRRHCHRRHAGRRARRRRDRAAPLHRASTTASGAAGDRSSRSPRSRCRSSPYATSPYEDWQAQAWAARARARRPRLHPQPVSRACSFDSAAAEAR